MLTIWKKDHKHHHNCPFYVCFFVVASLYHWFEYFWSGGVWPSWWWCCLLKKDDDEGVTKSNPTQKCRLAKSVSKIFNIQIVKHIDTTEQPNDN
jgi:hypothetical protein